MRYLANGAYRFFITGDVNALYEDGSTSRWVTRANRLLSLRDDLVPDYESELDTFDPSRQIPYSDFISECSLLIDQATELMRVDRRLFNTISNIHLKLLTAHREVLTTRAAESLRIRPFAVLIHSQPGGGKSLLVDEICKALDD